MGKMNVRFRLIELHLSYSWLISIMHRYGYEVDKTALSSAVNGTIKGERATFLIGLANDILDEYQNIYLRNIGKR